MKGLVSIVFLVPVDHSQLMLLLTNGFIPRYTSLIPESSYLKNEPLMFNSAQFQERRLSYNVCN
jgi:hypothetical protein